MRDHNNWASLSSSLSAQWARTTFWIPFRELDQCLTICFYQVNYKPLVEAQLMKWCNQTHLLGLFLFPTAVLGIKRDWKVHAAGYVVGRGIVNFYSWLLFSWILLTTVNIIRMDFEKKKGKKRKKKRMDFEWQRRKNCLHSGSVSKSCRIFHQKLILRTKFTSGVGPFIELT